MDFTKEKKFKGTEPMYHGILIGLYDIGYQYSGHFKKWVPKVIFEWEIVGEYLINGEPLILYKIYTSSLNRGATLRKDLESLRGKALSREELRNFDLTILLGANANLKTTLNDKNRLVIAEMRPYTEEKPTRPNFEMKAFEMGMLLEGIPEWIKKLIKRSKEYQEAKMIEHSHMKGGS